MNKEEYLKKIKELDEENNLVKRKLANKYLRANLNHFVGDTVEDLMGKILVKNIIYRGTIRNPLVVYSGVVLTKKGVPYKSGETRYVYDCNVIKGDK